MGFFLLITTMKKNEFDPTEPLENSQHEKFCQEIFSGRNKTEAYANAGFKKNCQNAYRLSNREDVKKRLDFLNAIALDDLKISRKDQIIRFLRAYDCAMDDGKWSSAVQAASAINKMLGLDEAEKTESNLIITINGEKPY